MRLLIAMIVVFAVPMHAAIADDDPSIEAGDSAFLGGASDATDGGSSSQSAGSSSEVGTYHQQSACQQICTGALTCPDGTFMIHSWIELPNGDTVNESVWCPSEGGPPVVTGGVVATAFKRIPLPPSTFSVQPPGGETLVNFETNFFTDEQTLDRTVRLLGQRVDLRIWAHSYTWHFGDGQVITTRKPGAAYPKLLITHSYLKKGAYRPAMDTTWVADYRVGGGAWQPVPGSVTIEGAAADLRAIEARPTLVGYDG